jgi:hypothetical protein
VNINGSLERDPQALDLVIEKKQCELSLWWYSLGT